ncbi:unnamed protein product [Cylicocyclus nassatus]|uniref:Uncharacterized protein n=1 Tax=Cylicocyclus nassatus TaxID=53992 RepID=A0AA36DVQ8_CYLNA|nr:unnamed protein product [Cylicocyclus nassatus]
MPVVLNVGGTKFYTSLETVKKNPGPLDKSIFANMNVVIYPKYLRDGYVRVDGNAAIRAQLKREAQFYGLENLVQQIERQSPMTMGVISPEVRESLPPGSYFATYY